MTKSKCIDRVGPIKRVRSPRVSKVGEGDDGIWEWEPPFDELFRRLEVILDEATELNLELPLDLILPARDPKILKELSELQGSGSVSDGRLFEALSPEAEIEHEQWGGDSPGRSGVWMTARIPARSLRAAAATLQQVVESIEGFWLAPGYQRGVDARRRRKAALAIEAARRAAETEALERKRLEEEKRAQEARREYEATKRLRKQIETFIEDRSSTYQQFDRALVTPNGRCFVLIENSRNYFAHHWWVTWRLLWIDWKRLMEGLRSQGIEVIEVVETYSPGAEPPRVEKSSGFRIVRYEYVSGWGQEQSLLTGTVGRICEDALAARRAFNQMRKIS